MGERCRQHNRIEYLSSTSLNGDQATTSQASAALESTPEFVRKSQVSGSAARAELGRLTPTASPLTDSFPHPPPDYRTATNSM